MWRNVCSSGRHRVVSVAPAKSVVAFLQDFNLFKVKFAATIRILVTKILEHWWVPLSLLILNL